jgi:hypothetical protein
MADADDVRHLALALPHVEEIDSDGFDFRVGGKGFVWSYPERRPGQPRVIRTDIAVLYVGDEAEKQALLLGEPGVFFTAPGYDGWPLVLLRLAEVDAGRLADLVTDAWRMRAPHELAAEFDEAAAELDEGAAGMIPLTVTKRSQPGITSAPGLPAKQKLSWSDSKWPLPYSQTRAFVLFGCRSCGDRMEIQAALPIFLATPANLGNPFSLVQSLRRAV